MLFFADFFLGTNDEPIASSKKDSGKKGGIDSVYSAFKGRLVGKLPGFHNLPVSEMNLPGVGVSPQICGENTIFIDTSAISSSVMAFSLFSSQCAEG